MEQGSIHYHETILDNPKYPQKTYRYSVIFYVHTNYVYPAKLENIYKLVVLVK